MWSYNARQFNREEGNWNPRPSILQRTLAALQSPAMFLVEIAKCWDKTTPSKQKWACRTRISMLRTISSTNYLAYSPSRPWTGTSRGHDEAWKQKETTFNETTKHWNWWQKGAQPTTHHTTNHWQCWALACARATCVWVQSPDGSASETHAQIHIQKKKTLRSTHVPPCNGKLRWTCINDRQVGPGYKTKTTPHKEQQETWHAADEKTQLISIYSCKPDFENESRPGVAVVGLQLRPDSHLQQLAEEFALKSVFNAITTSRRLQAKSLSTFKWAG